MGGWGSGRMGREMGGSRASGLIAKLRPGVRGENLLPQPDARRRDFHELIVVDELDGRLQAELPRRNEADGLIGGGGPHGRLLLFLGHVDVPFAPPSILAADPALVRGRYRSDDKRAAPLPIGNAVSPRESP